MKQKRGFTIIELSISLTIIALIIAGITSGLYLKRRSELMSIMDQVQKLSSAYGNFRDIYSAKPGDMHGNSLAFGTYYTVLDNGWNLFYGNSNGIIDNGASLTAYGTGPTYVYEGLIALQHLSLARMISGNFIGDLKSTTTIYNTPWYLPSPANNIYGYYFGSASNTAGANFSVFNSNSIKSSLVIYAKMSNTLSAPPSSISPTEMYKIDIKYDDGIPITGSVLAANGSDVTDGCINTTYNTYAISSRIGCYAGFILDKN